MYLFQLCGHYSWYFQLIIFHATEYPILLIIGGSIMHSKAVGGLPVANLFSSTNFSQPVSVGFGISMSAWKVSKLLCKWIVTTKASRSPSLLRMLKPGEIDSPLIGCQTVGTLVG